MTQVLVGDAQLTEVLGRPESGPVLGVVDPGVARSPLVDHAVDELIELDCSPPGPTEATAEAIAQTIASLGAKRTIGYGGGTLLDIVKVAVAASRTPHLVALIRSRSQRAGLILLPGGSETENELVLIPTTIGTSSEVSSVAVLKVLGNSRLLMGQSLRARKALVGISAIMDIPGPTVSLSAMEILFRLCSTVASSHSGRAAREDTLDLVDRLLQWTPHSQDREDRLGLAIISAQTQTSEALRCRDSFAAKYWYVAHELSSTLGEKKARATLSVAPEIWGRVLCGDRRWGDADALLTFWRQLRLRHAWLPNRPDDGIREIAERWGVLPAADPGPESRIALAHQIIATWGGALPMLFGLAVHDIAGVLHSGDWQNPRARGGDL